MVLYLKKLLTLNNFLLTRKKEMYHENDNISNKCKREKFGNH